MNFKKDIADLYDEIILEGSHGDVSAVKKLLKSAEKAGLVSIEATKKGYMLKSLVDSSQYLIHRGEKGFHDLRRFLQKLERISA